MWASDLHQWIPDCSVHVELYYNKHGNLQIHKATVCGVPTNRFRHMVFNRMGMCISHIPKYKAIQNGCMLRWPKLVSFCKF